MYRIITCIFLPLDTVFFLFFRLLSLKVAYMSIGQVFNHIVLKIRCVRKYTLATTCIINKKKLLLNASQIEQ